MSFWKKLTDFFLGPMPDAASPHDGPEGASPLEAAVWKACLFELERERHFTALAVADAATVGMGQTPELIERAARVVEAFYAAGRFASWGYTRSKRESGSGPTWIYHPRPNVAASGTSAGRVRGVRSSVGQLDAPGTSDPLDLGAILRLGADELRARALSRGFRLSTLFQRMDEIPSPRDEHTALVDRALELRGIVSREELDAIHRVGALYREHRHAARLVEALSRENARALVEEERLARRLAKQRKKEEAAKARAARAEAISERRRTDIVYLGRSGLAKNVSKGLSDRRSHLERLAASALPKLSSPADLAKALELDVSRLRFLAYHADAATSTHYVRFEVPKRRGGVRVLMAPKPELARVQRWILENVLERLDVTPRAHGFVKGRSTVTNARAHQGKAIVINQDLVDFFPSINFARVKAVFARAGYSPAVATILALLTTECPRVEARYAGKTYYVATGERGLPQGACTSPMISNLVAGRLDLRLAGYAMKHGFTYTRYADDLTFSASEARPEDVAKLLATMHHIVRDEGFVIHPEKGRIQRSSKRQVVTGIVVNEATKLGVPREELRLLRAILHNAKKTGLAAQNRELRPHFEAWLRGKIAYVTMVDRPRGLALQAELDALELGR